MVPAPQSQPDAPPTPAARAGCACLSMVAIGAAVFFGVIAAAADPAMAGGTFLAIGTGCGLLAGLAAGAGHRQTAWLNGLAALAFLGVGAAAAFGA
ncbi:hypothetical protein ACIBHX_32570 [Nonomuraea sp. NPDC050536]|uniref:hypothetical protein n=1 Tax=Nonomuraea sp. NPDC050536 TaxID=3364366 RepID=UPI0037C9B821